MKANLLRLYRTVTNSVVFAAALILMASASIGHADDTAPSEDPLGAQVEDDPLGAQPDDPVPAAETLPEPPAPTSATPDQTPPAPIPEPVLDKENNLWVPFALLSSFPYEPPSNAKNGQTDSGQIPEQVKELNGKQVAVQGFMIPVAFNEGRVTSFILASNQMLCCFGMTPRMNEFVVVEMAEGKTARYLPDLPVVAFGKLDVSERYRGGFVDSVYRMEGVVVEGPREIIARKQRMMTEEEVRAGG